MHETNRTSVRGRVTLTELIVVVLVLAVLVSMLLPGGARPVEEPRRIRCRNNLNQLAKGMATYLNEYGDGRWFPCPLGRGQTANDYNGAEWLALLYWTGVIPDPGVFICPSSPDDNDDGRQLERDRAIPGLFGSQTVSYAGMHYYSLGEGAAIRDDYPPNKPMASDDTQGDVNHGTYSGGGMHCGGMAILFFDSHAEFRTNTEVNLQTGVGSTDGDALLRELRN